MDSNALPSGVYSNVTPSMLGLEMSLHHQLQPQNQQNPHQLSHPHHPMAAYAHPDGGDYHLQPQQSVKHGYPSAAKSKNQSLTLSDDDEPGLAAENSADDGKRKMSPWQRMKWTDNMVRLLIMVVYYIGDEAGSEANEMSGKKKGSGVLQKKGKWKSVSKAMMERGFYVSPQQCEDKFNDLNKRYKRVNDILGKGTSCRVVENQSLLDTMDHLSPKMKEEVKKLLNSKHLFFREMCAYHNSCGHGGGSGGAPAVEPPQVQRCLHTEKAPVMSEGSKLGKGTSGDEEDDCNNDNDEEDDDDDDDDDEEEGDEGDDDNMSNVNDVDERSSRKRMRKETHHSAMIQQLEGEMMSMMRDGTKSVSEKKQWMRMKMTMLEEQHVGIQAQTFELEKQRLKWLKYRSKKEREMERERLRNERMKLENERMALVVKQKEMDLMEFQKQQGCSLSKRGDPSSVTG